MTSISSFKYPGARPLYIYVKNAHVGAIPAVRAFVAEFTKESAFGPNGYLRQAGLIAAPNAGPRAQPGGRARPRAAQPREPQVALGAHTTMISMRAGRSRAGARGLPRGGGGKGIE